MKGKAKVASKKAYIKFPYSRRTMWNRNETCMQMEKVENQSSFLFEAKKKEEDEKNAANLR